MQITELYDIFQKSTGISTDTRAIKPGNIFFALKGDRFNGNFFAEKALLAGAIAVVVDEQPVTVNEKLILVENVLSTLQKLANHHRNRLQTKIIAVAGSNGKTTTRELINAVFQTSFKTFSTKGNFNNHIGVPLSLLSIDHPAKPPSLFNRDGISPLPIEKEFAVIEMGANHSGETKLLCEIAEPDFGLITNNGKDHLEGYGSIEGVRKGNGELYDFLREKNRIAFVCADEDDLVQMSEGMNRITYGKSETANCRGKIEELFPFLRIKLTTHELSRYNRDSRLTTQLIGKYNFENVMAAVCIGNYFGITDEKIKQAIESYSPTSNRSQIVKRGTNTFILDAYNANPSSMNAALENFFALPEENKIAILGDMAELGTVSEKEHREVISKLKISKLKMRILVGDEFRKVLSDSDKSFLHFKNVGQLKEWFGKQIFENHFFLLKASRVIGLEKLIE